MARGNQGEKESAAPRRLNGRIRLVILVGGILGAFLLATSHSYLLGRGVSSPFSLVSWVAWCGIASCLAVGGVQLQHFRLGAIMPIYCLVLLVLLLMARGPFWNQAFLGVAHDRVDHTLLHAWAASLAVAGPEKPGQSAAVPTELWTDAVREIWVREPSEIVWHKEYAGQRNACVEVRWYEGLCTASLWIGDRQEVGRYVDSLDKFAEGIFYDRHIRR